MRKIRKQAVKPKILKAKIELAQLIKKHWEKQSDYREGPPGSYWAGTFKDINGLEVYIYFQNYIRRPGGVNFVKMDWANGKYIIAPDIKALLRRFNKI